MANSKDWIRAESRMLEAYDDARADGLPQEGLIDTLAEDYRQAGLALVLAEMDPHAPHVAAPEWLGEHGRAEAGHELAELRRMLSLI